METDDFFIVPHPLALDAPDQVDVYEYRIAAVQEVPEGDVANAAFVRWYRVGDVLEAAPDGMARTAKADVVALYAARVCPSGIERRSLGAF